MSYAQFRYSPCNQGKQTYEAWNAWNACPRAHIDTQLGGLTDCVSSLELLRLRLQAVHDSFDTTFDVDII